MFPKLGKNWFAFCLFSLKVVELVERGTVALEVPKLEAAIRIAIASQLTTPAWLGGPEAKKQLKPKKSTMAMTKAMTKASQEMSALETRKKGAAATAAAA